METTISTEENIVLIQSAEEVSLTTLQPSIEINTIESEEVRLSFTDVGVQGIPGARGPEGPEGPVGQPLTFDTLTEQQKLELRGDVGNTSTNFVNLFYDSLIS